MPVKCKFRCAQVTKSLSGQSGTDFQYKFVFYPVVSGSEENKEFYKYTPSGQLELSVFKDDLFEVGKEYYLTVEATP